jgi:hypothetical protein
MAVVLFIGFGFAALRNAGPLLAAATYNLAFLSLPTATVYAVVGQGRLRSLATGYAAFGSAYSLFNLPPLRPYNSFGSVQGRPKLLIEEGFILLQPYLHPMPLSGMKVHNDYDLVSQSLAIMLCGIVGAILARLLAPKDDRPNP